MQFLKAAEVRLRRWRNRLAPWRYRGDAVHCPVCEHSFRTFLPAGTGERRRDAAVCPLCRARERDRLTWLYLQRSPALFAAAPLRLLHIAPEPRLAELFRARAGEAYFSADLMRRDVDLRLDVSALPLADQCLDAIYCSHVLQDVPDDRAALAEFHRVLRPGGWAILNVPLFAERTRDNPRPGKARSPGDVRPDEHLRDYGHDYLQRLEEAGFEASLTRPEDLVPEAGERHRLGIDGPRTGFVHLATRPALSPPPTESGTP
jgi:SAM-dependent methyltransferase